MLVDNLPEYLEFYEETKYLQRKSIKGPFGLEI
jgi:hypothetical protein